MAKVTITVEPGHQAYTLAYHMAKLSERYEYLATRGPFGGEVVSDMLRSDAAMFRKVAGEIGRQSRANAKKEEDTE